MAMAVSVSDGNFGEVVTQAKIPVLVDFGAPWCSPCNAISPIIEELAKEYKGKVIFAKVDVDETPGVSSQFSIQSIPTLILFQDGSPQKQLVGFRSKQELKKTLDEFLR